MICTRLNEVNQNVILQLVQQTRFIQADPKIRKKTGLTDMVSFPYLVVDGKCLTK